jgi:hypothetical protein
MMGAFSLCEVPAFTEELEFYLLSVVDSLYWPYPGVLL